MTGLKKLLRYRLSISVGEALTIAALAGIINLIWVNVPLWVFAIIGATLGITGRIWPRLWRARP